ncbi:hypothetical protein DSM112329_02016 [Paraconexibacter sp. AEG42_29]|uniref:histidine kinase n=2 Tax=Paraconexibacter sp. AEG42_29 TaxID=2997339 RepID=A0AAU7AUM1_9ACTN
MTTAAAVGRSEVQRLEVFVGPTLVLAVLLAAGLNAFGVLAPDTGSAWAGLTVWVTVAALAWARTLLRTGRVADAALLVVLGTSFPCLTGVFGVPETCIAALLGGVWALAFAVSYLDGRALAAALVTGAAVLGVNLVLAATLLDSDLPGGAGPYVLVAAALSPGGALAIILLQLRHLRSDDRTGRSAAEEADRVKTEFLTSMSHELRTPMHAVIGLAELLRDGSLDAEQHTYVETIHASGEHLLGLINEILDYSRLGAGRLAVRPAAFDPVTCAEDAVALVAAQAQAKGLRLVLQVEPDVGELDADEHRVRQILVNLLGNAVKFTPAGEVTLRLGADGPTLVADVRDTGPGISEAQLATLFEPFAQLAADTDHQQDGTGLGLPISRRLAELMGGTLDGVPDVSSGSQFRLRLPGLSPPPAAGERPLDGVRVAVSHPHAGTQRAVELAVARLGAVVDPAASLRVVGEELAAVAGAGTGDGDGDRDEVEVVLVDDPGALDRHRRAVALPITHRGLAEAIRPSGTTWAAVHAEPAEAGVAGLRVLVAEDHTVNRHVMSALLSASGISADLVVDGREAVAAADRADYDLVLMDLHMPNLDGAAATRAIRAAAPAGRQPWIVVTSASVLDEDRARSRDAGADAFLPKPLNRAALAGELRRAADRHGRSRPG